MHLSISFLLSIANITSLSIISCEVFIGYNAVVGDAEFFTEISISIYILYYYIVYFYFFKSPSLDNISARVFSFLYTCL